MSFKERVALIDDDEEWLNIPPVLRRLLRHLNEENERNVALTEALRSEQRDTNMLLRRLIQKQTDMELDLARSNLLLTTKSNGHDASQGGKKDSDVQEQVRQSRKQLDKALTRIKDVEKNVKLLEEQLASSSDSIVARQSSIESRAADDIKGWESRFADARDSTNSRMKLMEDNIKALENTLTGESARIEHHGNLLEQMLHSVNTIEREAHETQGQLQNVADTIAASDESFAQKHAIADRRFTAVQRALEKMQSFFEEDKVSSARAQRSLLDQWRDEHQKSLAAQSSEMQELFVSLRQRIAEVERRCAKDCRGMEEQVESIVAKQGELLLQYEQVLLPDLTDLSRNHERLSKKVSDMDDDFNDRYEALARASRDDCGRVDAMAADKRATQASLATLHEKLQQLNNLVVEVRTKNEGEVSRCRGELDSLRMACAEGTKSHPRTVEQLSSLESAQRRTTAAVEALELREQSLRAIVTDVATQAQFAAAPSRTTPSEPTQPAEPLRKAIEDAARMFHDESAVCRETQRSLTNLQDATSVRVARVEQKIADLHTALDDLRHQPTPTASLPAWATESLQELSPALVELEAVKRRIAAVEASHQESHLGASSESRRYQELQVQTADTVEDTRRRMLELSRRVLAQEQQLAALASQKAMDSSPNRRRRLDDDDGPEEGEWTSLRTTVLRLTGDLTSVLEKMLVTEEAVATLRSRVDEGFTRLETSLMEARDSCDAKTTAVSALAEGLSGEVAALRDGQEAAVAALGSRVDERIDCLQKAAADAPPPGLSPEAVTAAIQKELQERSEQERLARQPGETMLAQLSEELRGVSSRTSAQAADLERLTVLIEAVREEAHSHQPKPDRAETPSPCRCPDLSPIVGDIQSQLRRHDEALQAQSAALDTALSQTVPAIQRVLEGRISDLEDIQSHLRSQIHPPAPPVGTDTVVPDVTAERLEGIQWRVESLEAELQNLKVRHADDGEHPERDTERKEEDAGPRAEVVSPADLARLTHQIRDLEADLRAYAYPRAELEERLENLWMSVVSLLARKEDSEACTGKLTQLQDALQEEMRALLEAMSADVETALKDKVGLQELEGILESQILSDGDEAGQYRDLDGESG